MSDDTNFDAADSVGAMSVEPEEVTGSSAGGAVTPSAEDIEASRTDTDERPPIYMTPGREGITGTTRRLVVFEYLPDRRKLEFQARNLLLESDIREAMAKAARRLFNYYLQRYSVLGWAFDPENIEYDITRLKTGMDIGADTQVKHTEGLARTLVASVVITRE